MRTDLIATSIEFTKFSIIYHVECRTILTEPHTIYSPNDIGEKDLILKSTYISENNMKVIYTPNNVWPSFYQDIFERTLNSVEEYENEIENIYNIGDVVAYVITKKRNKKIILQNTNQTKLFSVQEEVPRLK